MEYRWIENLPESSILQEIRSSELAALASVWKEKKGELEDNGAYREFLRKLQREWAIETGIIERLYSWDRGVTEVLIAQGIESSLISHQGGIAREEAEHIKKIIDDQLNIVDGLFSYIKGEEPLSEYFIRALHAQFTAHEDFTDAITSDGKFTKIPLLKGEYKKHPNNPRRPDGEVHEYCPPEFVKEEMEKLVSVYQEHEQKIAPEVLSAWLHHRFTQIHPFQDGNGRVARAIASLVFLKAGLFPLVIRDLERKEYIQALEDADHGDLKNLVMLFTRRQRDAILSALGLQQQVYQAKYTDKIIDSTIDRLKNKYAVHRNKLDNLYLVAEKLHETIHKRLSVIAGNLDNQLREITPPGVSPFHATIQYAAHDAQNNYYFYHQIVEVAKKFNYFANLDEYKSWVRLSITTEKTFEIIFSIHVYGHLNNGIMVVSALTSQRILTEERGREPIDTIPASPDLFQFNYKEPEESIITRFSEWLEGSLSIALAEWNRSIIG